MKWFRFYHEFVDDPKIAMMSDSDQLLWVKALCLASESKVRGIIMLSDEEICWKLRVTMEIWKHAIDKFRAKGMLDHHPDGYKITHWDDRQYESDSSAERTRAYRERLNQQIKEECDVTVTSHDCRSDENVTPPDTDTDPYSDPEQNRTEQNTHMVDRPKKRRKTDRAVEYTDEFEELWFIYPRKVKKKDAFELYQDKLAHYTSDEIHERLVYDLPQWKNAPQDKIPHATTWLNREDWTDKAWKKDQEKNTSQDILSAIAQQLKRLNRHGYLPSNWQQKTGKLMVSELSASEAQAYLLELQSLEVSA